MVPLIIMMMVIMMLTVMILDDFDVSMRRKCMMIVIDNDCWRFRSRSRCISCSDSNASLEDSSLVSHFNDYNPNSLRDILWKTGENQQIAELFTGFAKVHKLYIPGDALHIPQQRWRFGLRVSRWKALGSKLIWKYAARGKIKISRKRPEYISWLHTDIYEEDTNLFCLLSRTMFFSSSSCGVVAA